MVDVSPPPIGNFRVFIDLLPGGFIQPIGVQIPLLKFPTILETSRVDELFKDYC